MKLVLVSNYLNPHMKPLCDAFCSHSDIEKFSFVATTPFDEERKKMGFQDNQIGVPYVVEAYGSEEKERNALDIVRDADVAIVAHAPDKYIEARMQADKLTFLCSERFYRKGLWRRWFPSSYKKKWNRFLKYKDKQLYYLTIGAYTPYELSLLKFPLNRCFQWAYLPATSKSSAERNSQESKLEIFWAARMIPIKHPEQAIKLAQTMKKRDVLFDLKMAGDGELQPIIQKKVDKIGLGDCVHLLGNCTPENVQEHMKKSDVFLFSSDYFEGWGAVLNEAMAAGCVPVASQKAGASRVLIENGKNGFLFDTEKELESIMEMIVSGSVDLKAMSQAAQETINKEWNAEIAADRFVETATRLMKNQKSDNYESGPMKIAKVLKAGNYIYTEF